jgi:hypothetical protein
MADEPEQRGTGVVKVTLGLDLDFIARALGQPLEQAGGILADLLGMVRFELSLRLLRRARRKLAEAGLEQEPLRPVSLSRLLPILEWGSTESDESLGERWAALLANFVVDEDRVPPSFPDVLRAMTPGEARLLDAIYDGVTNPGALPENIAVLARSNVYELAKELGVGGPADVALENLVRLRLVTYPFKPGPVASQDPSRATITRFGGAFVVACRTPTPRA